MTVLALFSCDSNDNVNHNIANESTKGNTAADKETTDPNDQQYYTQEEKAMQAYEAALKNEIKVYETDIEEYSQAEAVILAQEYWVRFDIEDNGYIVVPGYNTRAPSSVYVMVMRRYVEDHWSTIDEIWIDKIAGQAIIPYWLDGK